jgi:TPR repeat protein
VVKDIPLAFKWYLAAANRGHANAQFKVGECYLKGEGVPESLDECVKWYRRACNSGSAVAQYNLGNLYSVGFGVKKDLVQAYALYDLASVSSEVPHAKDNREIISKEMTEKQIAQAKLFSEQLRKQATDSKNR